MKAAISTSCFQGFCDHSNYGSYLEVAKPALILVPMDKVCYPKCLSVGEGEGGGGGLLMYHL